MHSFVETENERRPSMKILSNSLRMARKDLKVVFKDRGQLAVLLALPLLLSLIFGGIFTLLIDDSEGPSGEPRLVIKTYIVNEDQGPYGAQVEDVLHDIRPLHLVRSRTADQADEKVAEGEAPAAIIIPADFSARIEANQPARVQLIKDPTRQGEAQAVAGILNEVLTELRVRAEIEYGIRAVFVKTGALESADPQVARAAQAQTMGAIWTAVQEMRQNPAIAVQREDLAGEEREIPVSGLVFTVYVPMFATMFAFFLVGFMAESILGEKEAGSFRRLLAAPIHRGTVIAGKMLAFVAVVFMQMLLLFGVGNLFFDMPLGDSPLGLLALTLALALASTGLGMLLGSISRTRKQAGAIGMVLGFALFFASGLPPSSVSRTGYESGLEGIRLALSQLTPHAHAYDGYLSLMLEGAGVADILPNILVLFGFGVVFFLVGLWRFRYE
jgi:ABC-2 type transport system permease protein